ncbi:DUF4037 domain-containing protein [Anaerotignum sp.]|nr:DUF4037 domain-containing protein [Anaerotignum sp.]MBQ7758595.1 DUF4037 domain-containing protein [Anaerotignum sp.]
MVEKLFDEFAALPQIEAIALGGSRAGEVYDKKSDYDVYLYCTSAIEEDVRLCILEKYCSFMEIGNHFWEYEDNCVLKNGIDIDILYRDLDSFAENVASVVEQYQACNGYTTCMWHNLKTCKIIYDRDGRLQAVKDRFSMPYPKQLKENIISKNMKLISDAMPAYPLQIAKAVERKDLVSIGHRTAAFMESYFDIIWAMNELTHPGEKRLVSLCKKQCSVLPANFEENINQLYADLFTDLDSVGEDVARIICELKKVISGRQIDVIRNDNHS